MRKLLFSAFFALTALSAFAQYPLVSISQINQPTDLAACNDTSIYQNDTVRTVAVVVTDGGLSEVASSSVIGGNRPFIFIVDTANGGIPGNYNGIEMMPIYQNSQGAFQPLSIATQLIAGDIIEVTGIISSFGNSNQISTLDANSITLIGSQNPPVSAVVPLSDFNDANRVNQLTTGEPYEGSYIELQNVTVTTVIPFGGGRISFDVADGNGNTMNISDRFLAQRTSAHTVVNPNSPAGVGNQGSFVPPVPGTFYNTLSGVIRHSGNGCTGGTGRGYELNPFLDNHYDVGYAPPFIDQVDRDPVVPNDQQAADISAVIVDSDGTVDSVFIYWTADATISPSNFTKAPMALAIGSSEDYEFTIPNHPNGTLVRYYIYAEDDQQNPSYYPSTPLNQTEPNFDFYTVRQDGLTIADVQFSLSSNGDSPFLGKEVKVKGVVTASAKNHDLGYVYIQDPMATEYAGIACIGHFGLADLYRNEWVEITGEVQESFGFTQIAVTNIRRLFSHDTIMPITVDPSDSVAQANGSWEKYESMLVKFENPGSKIYISDDNAGFGDYRVATDPSFGNGKSTRVLAGRQSNTSVSSLWVQLVTDTIYENTDGTMFVSAVTTSDTMTMDAIVGLFYYGFSNYRLLPRANDDIIGLNAAIDMNVTHPSNVSIEEIQSSTQVSIFPNPTNTIFHIETAFNAPFSAVVFDLNGRKIMENTSSNGGRLSFDASSLANGVYVLKIANDAGELISTQKVIVRK